MIRDTLDKYVQATDRQWKHDRTKTVGASEIGQCARRTAWMKRKQGNSPGHVDSWGARVRGSVIESHFWHPALKKRFGKDLLYAGAKQKSLIAPPLSATPDGLVCNLKPDALRHLGIKDIQSDCILVECKTIDPRVNLIKEKEENAYQVQVQLGIVREKTKHRPEYALISYIDASFWNEILEFPVKFDSRIYQGAKDRAHKILTQDPKSLPPEGWIAGGHECEYCPFTKPCGIIRRSVPEKEAAADPQFVAEITDACQERCNLDNQIEELQARLNAKDQEIKDRLREKGVRRIPRVVVWSAVKGRKAYDNVALREAAAKAGVDIEAFSTVGEPSDRLQIFPIAGRASPATPETGREDARRWLSKQ